MKPSEVSVILRRVAAHIDVSKSPSRSAITKELRHIIAQLSPEEMDVHNLMEKGLPRSNDGSDPGVIRSNYSLDDADIYYSFDTDQYDNLDKPVQLPDTMETQMALSKKPNNAHALVIWPDADIEVHFDYTGSVMESGGHLLDETGKPKKTKSGFHERISPYDVGIRKLQQILEAAGPGSLITNAKYDDIAKKHGYNIWR